MCSKLSFSNNLVLGKRINVMYSLAMKLHYAINKRKYEFD